MDVKLTQEGDIDLGDNYTMKLCTRKEELVRQRIYITLRVNRGEWQYDTNFGTPWLTNQYNNFSILGKVPVTVFDSEIRQQILSREGVVKLLEYETIHDRQTRQAKTKAKVLSESGEIITISDIINT